MKSILLLIPLAIAFLFYPTPPTPFTLTVQVPQEIYPCGGEQTFTITITNSTGSTLTDVSVAYLFDVGIQYVPQSVSGGSVLEANIADLTKPEFLLPQIPAYGTVVVKLRAKATCQAETGPRLDTIVLTHNGSEDVFSSDGYNVKSPKLSFNANQMNFTGIPGMTFVQDLTLKNTGLGSLEGQIAITLNYPAAQIQVDSVSHGELSLENPNWVTRLDSADLADLGYSDGILETGESVTLQVWFTLLPVNGATSVPISFWAGWGCGGSICKQDEPPLNGTVSISNAQPVFYTKVVSVQHPKLCLDGNAVVKVENTGQALIPGAAMGRNIKLLLSNSNNQNPLDDCIRFYNFKINGIAITAQLMPTGYQIDLASLTGDPGGSGGLICADNDSIFNDLPEGAFFQIAFDIAFDTVCLTDCQGYFYRSFRMEVRGENWLNQQVPNTFFGLLNYSYSFLASETLALGYAADSTFTAIFNISGGFGGGFGGNACPNDRLIIRIILPPVVSVPAGFQPTLNNIALTWSQQGDTLTLIASQPTGALKLPLKAVCDTIQYNPTSSLCSSPFDQPPPTHIFKYWLEYFCDVACPVSLQLLCRESPPFVVSCPVPEHNSGGISPGTFDVRRVSLGWTDATMTSQVFPNTPGLQLDIAMPRQIVQLQTAADIKGPGIYDSIQLVITHFTNALPWLAHQQADTLFFTDVETGISKICPLTEVVNTQMNGSHRLVFPLAGLFTPGGCFEGFHLTEGDALIAKVYAKITDQVPYNLTEVPGLRIGFAVYQNGQYVLCRERGASLRVIKPILSNPYLSFTSQGACEAVTGTFTLLQTIYSGVQDLFPHEFFPMSRFLSVKITAPGFFTFEPGSAKYIYEYDADGIPGGSSIFDTIDLPNPQEITVGSKTDFVFSLPSDLPLVDLMKQNTSMRIVFKLLPECLQQQQPAINYHIVYQNFVYAGDEAETEEQDGGSFVFGYHAGTRTLMPLNSNPTEAPGLASWKFDLIYQSASGQTVPFNWLQILLPPGVEAVELLEIMGTGNIPVALTPYDTNGNVWAKIGQHAPLTTRRFELTVRYEVCKPDTVRVRSNFQCFDYPPHPDSVASGCSPQPLQMMLFLQPKYAQLDLKIIAFPSGEMLLCEPWLCEIKILNISQGRAFTLSADIALPEKGMSIVPGSCEIRQGNGPYQPISNPDQIPDTNTWVWDNLPLINAELPGQVESPLNEYFIRFRIKTDCEYVDRSQFTVRTLWENACGDSGASPQYVSPVLQLKGAPDSLNQFAGVIAPEGGLAFVACGGQNRLIVRIQNQGGSPGNVTTSDEFIKIELDSVQHYEPFSFVNIQNMGAAGEPVASTENGRQVLEWPMPPGVAAGEWIEFSFAAAPTTLPCTDLEVVLEISQTATIPCVEAPGGACDIRFVETRKTFSIPVEHPAFDISGLSGTSLADGTGGEVFSLKYFIEKTTATDDTLGNLTITFFRDENGNGTFDPGTDTLAGQTQHNVSALQPGQPSPFQTEITVPGHLTCGGFFVVIDPADNPCLCQQSVQYVPAIFLENAGASATVCFGETFVLGTTPNPGYSYEWSPANLVSDPSSPNPLLLTNAVQPGNAAIVQLVLTSTRPGGCSSADSVEVKITHPKVDLQTINPLCHSGLGSAIASALGGEAPFVFIWNNGATGDLQANLPVGIYSVTATEAGGCSATQTVTLESPPAIVLATQVIGADCKGNTTGSATVLASGGTGVFTYLWSNGAFGDTATNLPAGSISVTATDANGCSQTMELVIPEPADLQVSYEVQPAKCPGGTGSISIEVSGGTPLYSTNGILFSTTLNITDLPAGAYTFTVMDANGCTTSVADVVPGLVSVFDIHSTDAGCFGEATGSACVELVSGQAPIQVLWANGQPTLCIENLTAGSYIATVTDSEGCTDVLEVSVGQPPLLTGLPTATHNACHGDHAGSAKATMLGGTPPYHFVWSNGATTAEISGLPAGVWQVTVTDAVGCQWFGSVETTQPTLLQVALSSTRTTCHDGDDGLAESQTTGGTPPYQYAWDTGETSASLYDLEKGIYSLIVTDALGCSVTGSVTVEDADPMNLIVEALPPTCVGKSDGEIEVIAPLGNGFRYKLNEGVFQDKPFFDHLSADGYRVYVQNPEGCETDTFVALVSPVETLASVSPKDTVIDLGQTVTIVMTVNDPSVQVYWHSKTYKVGCDTCLENEVQPSTTTLFKIEVTTPDGCSEKLVSKIAVRRCCIYFPNIFSPNDDGENDVFYPQANRAVSRIRQLAIFDRWGDMVFERSNFLPNDSTQGWDGRTRGKDAPPAVYVFTAEVEWLDGVVELYKGNVTLIR